jgi:hypothetical protein
MLLTVSQTWTASKAGGHQAEKKSLFPGEPFKRIETNLCHCGEEWQGLAAGPSRANHNRDVPPLDLPVCSGTAFGPRTQVAPARTDRRAMT